MRVAPEPEVHNDVAMAELARGCESACDVSGNAWIDGDTGLKGCLAEDLGVLQRFLAVQHENTITFVSQRIQSARCVDAELHHLRSDNRDLRAQLKACKLGGDRRRQLLVEGQEVYFKRHEKDLLQQSKNELGKDASQIALVSRARAVARSRFQALPDADKMAMFPPWKEVIASDAAALDTPAGFIPSSGCSSGHAGGAQVCSRASHSAASSFTSVVPIVASVPMDEEKARCPRQGTSEDKSGIGFSPPSPGAASRTEFKEFREELQKWCNDVRSELAIIKGGGGARTGGCRGSYASIPSLRSVPGVGRCPSGKANLIKRTFSFAPTPDGDRARKGNQRQTRLTEGTTIENENRQQANQDKKGATLFHVLAGKVHKRQTPSAVSAKFLRPSVLKAETVIQGLIDAIIAACILINGLFMGLSTNYMAENCTDDVPEAFSALEMVFAIIFTTELVFRIWKHKKKFFTMMEGWQWNAFDSFLVVLQLWDVVMEFYMNYQITGDLSSLKNVSAVKLLRFLRILRVLRLVRLLAFFGELNVVTEAIVGSFKSLVGAILMLLLVMYIVGIVFTQFATVYRIDLKEAGAEEDDGLLEWWSSLSRAILSLYQSIHGGADWNDILIPLFRVNWFLGILFIAYVAFVLLAMLNVITGIFVESALKNAERTKDKSFAARVKQFFKMTDVDQNGLIQREEFEACMEDPAIEMYMKDLGIEADDALLLFEFLDEGEDSDGINGDALLKGLLRLRAGAKFTDLMHMFHEIDAQKGWLSDRLEALTAVTERIDLRLQGADVLASESSVSHYAPPKYLS